MADWSVSRVEPGKKAYLFVGPAGNALDHLVRQATTDVTHVASLWPPCSSDALSVTLSIGDESQAIVVRDIEKMTDDDWDLIDRFLRPAKVRGQSLVLVGHHMSDSSSAKAVRARVQRQGQLVDVSTPTGQVGRKDLEGWVEREWKTSSQAARLACVRADYSVETLFWGWLTWQAVTNGKSVTGNLALQLVETLIPVSPTETLYRTLLERRPPGDVRLSPGEALGLFKMLESALSDLMLMAPVLLTGASLKTVSGKTGIHIVRVLDLAPLVPRYPPAAVAKCRQALAFGFAHHREPEVGFLVATLWG